MQTPKAPVSKLIFELSKLPGVGEKTATRLAYFILKQDETYARSLSQSIVDARTRTILCETCFNFTEENPCSICKSSDRDHRFICVVERPPDVLSIEQAHAHRGVYHVLHGTISPLDGIGPEDLRIRELLARIQNSETPVREVLIATNPSVEGEATGLYLARLIRPLGIKVTKVAYGIPVGGMLEYSDRQTIHRALENRVEIHA